MSKYSEHLITNIPQAEAWRASLSPEDEKYMYSVDKFVAGLKPGKSVNLRFIVSGQNMQKFITCLSFILTVCDLVNEFAFNDDFMIVKRLEKW